jgi:hypothetical protein
MGIGKVSRSCEIRGYLGVEISLGYYARSLVEVH